MRERGIDREDVSALHMVGTDACAACRDAAVDAAHRTYPGDRSRTRHTLLPVLVLDLPYPMQSSSSDVFVVPESSRMQVDEVVDNLANPSTPMKLGSVSPMAQSGISISDEILHKMYTALGRLVQAGDEDDVIKDSLELVWGAVKRALRNYPKMGKYLASLEEFF